MRIRQDAAVVTADGDRVGDVDRVVLNPGTGEVSHVVVRKGLILTEDKVVPVDLIAEANEDQVRLRARAGDLDQLPDFEETHYIRAGDERGDLVADPAQYAPPFYWYPPVIGFRPLAYAGPLTYGYPGPGYVAETERNIPPGTIAIKDGAKVVARDGEELGEIAEIITDPESEQTTHFVMESGLLTKTRKLIPAHWVWKVDEDVVQLGVRSGLVEQLEEYRD